MILIVPTAIVTASAPSCVNTPEAFLLLPFVASPGELHTETHTLLNKEVPRNILVRVTAPYRS